MKVIMTTPARFPAAFQTAHYHAARGELTEVISPVPDGRVRRFGLGPLHRSWPAFGAWNQAATRVAPDFAQAWHQAAFSAAFDAAAAHALGAANCDVVNPWCTTALRTIRAAHVRGIPVVLEVASAHIVAQQRLIDEECRRTGMARDRGVLAPAVLRRTLAEYDEADCIVVTSRFVKRTFEAEGVDPAKITVIPYGIDLAPAPVVARPERSDAPRILFVGGTTLRKGMAPLFAACRALERAATLRLVGRADAALFTRLGGLPAGIEVAGVRVGRALAAEYASADVFVLPSIEDGFGLVTLEAMRAGLPVVVSDRAGSAECVREGIDGYVVPAGDADALAERLRLLVGDAALRQRMGTAARENVAGRTWASYGDERHNAVYRPLLGERAGAERGGTDAAAA